MTFPLVAAAMALLACALVGRTAGLTVARLRPAQAVVLLAVMSIVVSLASGIALSAIAVAVIASLASVAAAGQWSAPAIRAEVPIPGWLGALAAAVVVVLLIRGVLRAGGILLALVRADRLSRDLRGGGGPVVIVDDESTDAYTIAGLRGCVIISHRLLAELSDDERRVLTAHELSHLGRRHHLYVHMADIAAAGNPLLRPVSAAVRLGVERWADEDAAVGIGDRRVAGRALARVALLRAALGRATVATPTGVPRPPIGQIPVMGVAALHVAARVQALLEPAPRCPTTRVVMVLATAVLVLLIGVASLDHIHEAIEGAESYLQRRR